jgi:hypothetical protein
MAANRALSSTAVAAGFTYSLATRRLDLRSALGSYAATVNLRPHPYTPWDGVTCGVCGTGQHTLFDINSLNFARFKWGGVGHLLPEYAGFDLAHRRRAPTTRLGVDADHLRDPPGTELAAPRRAQRLGLPGLPWTGRDGIDSDAADAWFGSS